MRRALALSLVGLALSASAGAQSSATYDATVRGARCARSAPRQLDCDYRVGSLQFTIAGVGAEDAAITFVQVHGYGADYYATVGVLHGCVIVKPGTPTREAALERGQMPGMAFVSPRDGKVYRTWPECARASNRR